MGFSLDLEGSAPPAPPAPMLQAQPISSSQVRSSAYSSGRLCLIYLPRHNVS